MNSINGIPLIWDTDSDKNLFSSLFQQENNAAFPAFSANTNVPVYTSPLLDYQWQNYDMDELEKLIEKQDPLKYNFYNTSFTESSPYKIRYPEIKQEAGFSQGDNKKNADFAKTIITTGLLDAQPAEKYNIYIVTSHDGDGLRTYFNMATAKPEDLIFFLEDNTGDISAAVLLCKMGDKWRQRFAEKKGFSHNNKDILNEVDAAFNIDAAKFDQLLQTGEIKGYPWLDTADKAGKIVMYTAGFVFYITCMGIAAVMELLIEGLEALKIPESGWLPSVDKPEDFKPALIGDTTGAVIEVTTEIIATVIEACAQSLKSLEKQIDDILNSNSLIDIFIQKVVGGFLTKVKSFIATVADSLEALKAMLETMKDISINVINAFLCGIINGFVDAVIGLATLIKWMFDIGKATGDLLSDMKNKLPAALEILDNLIDAWKKFSFKDLFSAFKNQFVKFIRTVFNELSGGIDMQEMYCIAYFAGNIIGFIIEFVIELIVTGGVAAVTKFFESFAEMGVKITQAIKDLLKAIFNISLKKAAKDIISGLRIAIRFFSATTKDIAEFVAKLFEKIKAIFGIGLSSATEELFEKLGLTWKSKLIPRLNSVLPTGEKIYELYHKGIAVARGSKKEIEELAEKLKGMSEDAAVKYLDELFEEQLIKNLLEKFPGLSEFEKWFDDFNYEYFELIWKDPQIKSKIASRIRHPGGMHEWLLVSRTNIFKKWGITMNEIKSLRSKIEDVIFKNPFGKHGGFGSTKAHNELLKLIDESDNFPQFKKKLINWAENRLEGGSNKLPKDFLK